MLPLVSQKSACLHVVLTSACLAGATCRCVSIVPRARQRPVRTSLFPLVVVLLLLLLLAAATAAAREVVARLFWMALQAVAAGIRLAVIAVVVVMAAVEVVLVVVLCRSNLKQSGVAVGEITPDVPQRLPWAVLQPQTLVAQRRAKGVTHVFPVYCGLENSSNRTTGFQVILSSAASSSLL